LNINEENKPEIQPDYHAMSDDDLLLAMAEGGNIGHGAFEAFSVRYIQPLNRLTYRLGFKNADCEDMLQDILVHIWQKAPLWNKQKNISARAWIYRVATNLCIDTHRKNARQPAKGGVDIDVVPLVGAGASDLQSQQTERKAHIDAALLTLPERSRTALVLIYYQELSNKEAAQTMGVSVKAIEALLVRGRKMLKKSLKTSEGLL
jgi:RNA polymerase sigma-70 factor (ECF subfamily)